MRSRLFIMGLASLETVKISSIQMRRRLYGVLHLILRSGTPNPVSRNRLSLTTTVPPSSSAPIASSAGTSAFPGRNGDPAFLSVPILKMLCGMHALCVVFQFASRQCHQSMANRRLEHNARRLSTENTPPNYAEHHPPGLDFLWVTRVLPPKQSSQSVSIMNGERWVAGETPSRS